MRTYTIFFLIFLPLFFCKCNSTKKAISNYDSNQIKDLLIFPIYAKIDVIASGDKRTKSETLSSQNESSITTLLEKYIPDSIKKQFLVCNDSLKEEISKSGISLIKSIKISLLPKTIDVPNSLFKVLDSLNKDYGLFILNAGFTRTPENLVKQYIVRKEISIASLGFYNTEPNKSYSIMIGVLIDKKRRKISYYKELYWKNRNPNESLVLNSQLRDIMLYYFQTTR